MLKSSTAADTPSKATGEEESHEQIMEKKEGVSQDNSISKLSADSNDS